MSTPETATASEYKKANHQVIHDYHDYAKKVALRLNKDFLLYEFAGTLSVILVFVICVFEYREHRITYADLMAKVVLSYLISTLVPKICNAFAVVTEGALPVSRFLNN
jgi:hypothetical protein